MAKKADRELNVGLIGGGGIAVMHLECLSDIPGVNLVGVADISEPAAKRIAERFEIPHAFTDYTDLLKLKGLDAVTICTPNYLHCEHAIAALKAGKHVMVEKPLALSVKEGTAMVAAAKKARKVFVIGFQHRYQAITGAIKRAIDDGVLGNILYARCHALRRRGIPNWGVFGRKELQGGGPLIDIGVHILETAHYLMGKPEPIAASGACHTYMGNKKSTTVCPWPNWDHQTYTVEDLATGYVRFKNGATLQIEACFAGHIEKEEWNVVLMGEKGGANWNPAKIFTDQNGTMVNIEPQFCGEENMWTQKMTNWIDSIRTGRKPMSPAEDGLAVQKMVDAIYKSAEIGREVAIK